MQPWRVLSKGLLVLAILYLGGIGCGVKSGILLEITTRDEGLRVDRLVFLVSPEVNTPDHLPRFVRDDGSSVSVNIGGRDLIADPYRLFLSDGRGGAADVPLLAAVLGYRDGQDRPVAFGALPPHRFVSGEVLLHTIFLEARSDVAPTPTGCVSWEDGESGDPEDRDCDGVSPPADCDDMDPKIGPHVSEVCANGVDDDCDGATDEAEDRDGDGVDQCRDCDDDNPAIYPGAPGSCDGLDNDCNGSCDEGFDADGDGVTSCGSVVNDQLTCGPLATPDCRDDDPTISPKEPDICNGRDDDCDGQCDTRAEYDQDGDGYTTCGTLASLATEPGATCGTTSPLLVDCDDDDDEVHPFAHEVCNDRDDNCDGVEGATAPCFARDATGCALGKATCDDDDGEPGLGSCVADLPRVPVAGALCTAIFNCGTDPDAFVCAVTDAATWKADCDLWVRRLGADPTLPARFEVCPDASAALPQVADAPGCLWQIVGDVAQEQLRVGLSLTRGAPATGTLASCTGRFAVTGLAAPLAFEPGTIVVLFADAARPDARAARFQVLPRLVPASGACPANPLVCNIAGP